MNNESQITSPVIYSGNVSVKIKIKDKIIHVSGHNSGEPLLMKMFAQFLSGNISNEYGAAGKIPTRVNLCRYDELTGSWISLLINPVVITNKVYLVEGGKWKCRLTSIIQYGDLLNGAVSSTDEGPFRLELLADQTRISPTESNLLATMQSDDLSGPSLSKIMPGTSAIFEWELQLINQGDE